MRPPFWGYLKNGYGESCGSFIRSEIWACLCPGYPGEAAKFAYEDAIVDHYRETVYAEMFCVAAQSVAFTSSDTDFIIDTTLTYIPENCGISKVIKFVREYKENGLRIHQQYFANIKFYADDGLVFTDGNFYSEPLQNLYDYEIIKEFEVISEEIKNPVCNIIADISLSVGHTTE